MKSHKELKEEYRQKKFRIGVYQVRNIVNGKVLIGSSVNLDAVWNRIRMELSLGGYRNETLQGEWTAMGADSFVFEVLSEIKQDDDGPVDYGREAKKLEELFIEERQPFGERGYHVRKSVC